jgi:MFS family permease
VSEDDSADFLTPRQKRALTRVTSDRTKIFVLASTGLIAAFMQTLVTPIIPNLPDYLDTTSADAFWVLISTLLAACVSIPISGRLGDMYGKRRIVLVLIVIMLVGSVVCALSNTLVPMIVGRSLQGIGLGVIALGISILRDVVHPKNLGGAIALVSATLGIGGAVGLPIAAVIAQSGEWHWLFWLATALAAVAFVAVLLFIPVSTLRTGGRFDFIGAVGLAIGLVCILLAISKGSEWGWGSAITLGLLIGGVVVLLVFGLIELRVPSPLIDLRVASRRPVLLTNLSSIAVGFAFFVVTAALPIVLELPVSTGVGLGLALIPASFCLAPLGLVMFLTSPLSARLTAARGPRSSLLLGLIVITVGFLIAIALLDQVWHVILISTITGLGAGFAYAAMPTIIMRAVPPTETAAANGLNSVMRTLGSTMAATLVGVILSVNSTLVGGLSAPTRQALVLVFVMAAGVTLAGVVLTLFIPRRTPNYDTSSIPIQSQG